MNLLAYIRSLNAKFFDRSTIAAEMEDEMQSHVEHRADDLERSGLIRAEAERQARIELGARERFKEDSYLAMGGNWNQGFFQDLRLSIRTLRKSPGFLIAAVFTLALAVGANAVVFSVLNAFILRPLNIPHPESLFGIWRMPAGNMAESYPDFRELRNRNRSFDDLMAYNMDEVGLDTGESPSRIYLEEASGNFFDALALQPYLGRFFHLSDERGQNSAPYIVLTYAFWQDHFQGDRNIVGRAVRLNKHPYTVIGVAQPEFHGTILFFHPDGFVPLVNSPQLGGENLDARGTRWIFMTMGHLKPGVTQAQAIADLNSIGSDLAAAHPKEDAPTTYKLARPSLYGEYIGRPARQFLGGLMLLAGLILLAACANLGTLFAARAADRSREIALRLALGSTRKRILRGLFTEAMLISLLGGAVGLAGSLVLLRALSAWQPFSRWPLHLSVSPDARVCAVALALALASGILFGAVPVNQILRATPYEVIKQANARVRGRIAARDLLLVVQIAICAVLVTSSLVAVRGLVRSLHGNFGFDVQNTTLAETDMSMAGYTGADAEHMQRRMIDSVASIPGVASAGLADQVPLGDGADGSSVFLDTTTNLNPANATAHVLLFRISPEYFQAAGTVLLSGRMFARTDDMNSPRVAIVNLQFVRQIFGSAGNAIGHFFKLPDGTRIQIVGIAENGKYSSLTEDPQPVMFRPILQSPSNSAWIVVRSSRDSQQVGTAIRGRLRELDPGLPVYIESRYKEMDPILFAPRMATISLGVLGMIGAILSITGIFGMAAFSVSRRLRELGIRIALGAKKTEVLRSALARPVRLLVIGSCAGLILGILAAPVLAFIVDQATPRDPFVLAGVVGAMALLGTLATWIPAQRALCIDPLILLREE